MNIHLNFLKKVVKEILLLYHDKRSNNVTVANQFAEQKFSTQMFTPKLHRLDIKNLALRTPTILLEHIYQQDLKNFLKKTGSRNKIDANCQ
jgi:hypothetical protein